MKTVRMELMRNPTQIRLYDIFRKDLHMPEDRAQNLVSTINDALNDHIDQDREDLATKAFVKDEILATKGFVKDEILATKEFVRVEIQSVKDELRAEIREVKDSVRNLEVKTTRSIYFANLIQFLAIVGAILAIYTFLRK
jgi:hypothetical protein